MYPTQDDLIKNLLLQPRLLQDFLHAFLPKVFEFADFELLEYLDKEHPRTRRKPQRRGDLLIKVRWKAEVGMFLIHIESQGQAQDIIVQRAAEYCLRDSIQYRLPVMPLVLLTYAGQRSAVPEQLDWRFGKLAAIRVKCPILHFQLMDPQPFLKGKNLVGLALANLMNVTPEQRVEAIVNLLAESLRRGLSPTEETALVEFAMMVRELSETQLLQLDEKITTLSAEDKTLIRMPKLINPFVEIGKIKGRQEGRQEGELALVLRMLKRKFPKVNPKLVMEVKQLDEETLLSFGEALLFMQTPDDCAAWLKTRPSAGR